MAWTPSDGYFGTLLAALFGRATRRVEGRQDSGGASGVGGGRAIGPDAALSLSAVWACVKLVSEAVGAMPVRVWRVSPDGSQEPETQHWIHSLLNEAPNQYQTRNEFFETVVINLMLAGNSYCVKQMGNNGRVLSLLPMMASQTEVQWSRGKERRYLFTDGTNVVAYGQSAVWHTMLMPSNGIIGLSPLQYGARTMGIATSAEERVNTLAANGFKPTGVLMIDKTLKPEQRDAVRAQYASLAEGEGDPLKVLEAGMTYQQVSISPRDAQLLESRRFAIEDIARFYGVPSVLINDTSATTVWGSGIGEIKEGFYALNLRPLLERLESSLSRWLLPMDERRRIAIEFDFSSLLRGNESQRVDTMTKAISGKLLTMDEARKRFDGLPPYPNGVGAVPYDQSQMIPVGGADGATQTSQD